MSTAAASDMVTSDAVPPRSRGSLQYLSNQTHVRHWNSTAAVMRKKAYPARIWLLGRRDGIAEGENAALSPTKERPARRAARTMVADADINI